MPEYSPFFSKGHSIISLDFNVLRKTQKVKCGSLMRGYGMWTKRPLNTSNALIFVVSSFLGENRFWLVTATL